MRVEDAGEFLKVTLEPGDTLDDCRRCDDSAIEWWSEHRNIALSRAAAAKGNHFHYGWSVS